MKKVNLTLVANDTSISGMDFKYDLVPGGSCCCPCCSCIPV